MVRIERAENARIGMLSCDMSERQVRLCKANECGNSCHFLKIQEVLESECHVSVLEVNSEETEIFFDRGLPQLSKYDVAPCPLAKLG